MIELRIHHFFDILRDYGQGKIQIPHKYHHSYYHIADKIYKNEIEEIRLVLKSDYICINCIMLDNGHCKDVITHRSDFGWKEDFNNYIDKKIMGVMDYSENIEVKVKDIILQAYKYIASIHYIYRGNDFDHTQQRKIDVSKDIDKKIWELSNKVY